MASTSDDLRKPRSEAGTARLLELLAAAVHSLAADGAAFIFATEDGARCQAATGIADRIVWTSELIEKARWEPLLLIERADYGDPASHALLAAGVHFFASARVGTEAAPLGFLALCRYDPGTLSGAQEYVLLTFATQIAMQLELEHLRIFKHVTLAREVARDERLRLLESVVVNAHDSVLITEAEPIDLPGPRIVYANAAFTSTTGYSLDEVLGKTPRLLQGEDTSPAARNRLRDAFHAWQPVQVELLNYRKDRTPFWVELSIVPVADASGYFTHWVSVQRDVTERKAAEEIAVRARVAEAANDALQYQAYHDDLTGLRNRAHLNDLVQSGLDRLHDGDGRRFAVLFFDLDRFKIVNDGLGHRVGDLLLIEFARRLEGCIRPQDTLGRLSGDEFICVIEAEEPADVVAVADRILTSLRAPIRLAGREIFASTSIGIAHVDDRYKSSSEVFRDADTAMYRAKNNGGGRFELFHETMHERALATLRVQMDLRGAIERGEFVVYYQPLVTLDDGRAYGFEALVRWMHPEHGLVSPAEFIPIAEETGLIVHIGTWVLRKACSSMSAWQAAAPEAGPLTLSVNVSSRQLNDPRFLADLEEALAYSGLDPRSLQLEITESIFLDYELSARELLQRIRALGVRIALDDFGTGYSSLSYLERFPIDVLKIDQSFVARLLTTPTTREIVRLIVGLARALDMDVVAEGVEKREQWEALRQFGCLRAQGYFFSHPLPESEIPALIGSRLTGPERTPATLR